MESAVLDSSVRQLFAFPPPGNEYVAGVEGGQKMEPQWYGSRWVVAAIRPDRSFAVDGNMEDDGDDFAVRIGGGGVRSEEVAVRGGSRRSLVERCAGGATNVGR
jgi:hypothetical protein